MPFPNELSRLKAFINDVAEEPAAIRRVTDRYMLDDTPLAMVHPAAHNAPIIFAGMGSSYYASLASVWWVQQAGIPAWATFAAEVTSTSIPAGATLVVTSQSGNTKECIRAIENFRAGGGRIVIGVTNKEDCKVVEMSDVSLPILAGPEGGISAKSYVASVAVLTMLAGVLTGDDALSPSALAPAAEASSSVMVNFSRQVDALCELVTPERVVHVLGSGAGLAAAEEGALILKEGPKYPFEGMLTSEWLHGSFYTVRPGSFTGIVLGGSPAGWRDEEAREKIQELGGSLITMGGQPGSPVHIDISGVTTAIRPLVEIAPLELLAAELWKRRLVSQGLAVPADFQSTSR